jgi:hypothetical protein
MPEWLKLAILVLVLSMATAGMLSGRPIEHEPGVLVDHEPVQLPTQRPPFEHERFVLTPQASYDIEARVLGVEPYRFEEGAKLSPLDLAVGWGAMSDSAVLEHFRVTQSARFFTIYPDEDAIDLGAALLGSANMHLIPASRDIERQLRDMRPGSLVHLRGLLVNATGPNHYTWNTSLRRSDSGAGACELFYVEAVASR